MTGFKMFFKLDRMKHKYMNKGLHMCPVEVGNGRCIRDEDRSIREEKMPET